MTPDEIARNKGSLIHAIAAEYHQQCYKLGVPSDPHLMTDIVNRFFWHQAKEMAALKYVRTEAWSHSRLDLYARCPGAWKRHYGATAASSPDFVPIPMDEYQDVARICFMIADRMFLDLDDYYGTETTFTADVGGYQFQARLDLVHVRGTVATNTDLKTGFGVKSQAQTDADFQLSTQAVALFAKLPHLELVKSNFYFPRFNVLRESVRTIEDVERTRNEIVQRIQQIERDDEFRYTPGDGCAWCGFKDDCPRLAEAIAAAGNLLAPVTSDVAGLAALERIVLLTAALKDAKAKLKPWAKLSGPVVSAGMAYGEHDDTRISYPPRAIVEAFEGTDVDAFSLMSVGLTKLASALKREPDLEDVFDAAKIVKPGVKCDLHKSKEASNVTTG